MIFTTLLKTFLGHQVTVILTFGKPTEIQMLLKCLKFYLSQYFCNLKSSWSATSEIGVLVSTSKSKVDSPTFFLSLLFLLLVISDVQAHIYIINSICCFFSSCNPNSNGNHFKDRQTNKSIAIVSVFNFRPIETICFAHLFNICYILFVAPTHPVLVIFLSVLDFWNLMCTFLSQ